MTKYLTKRYSFIMTFVFSRLHYWCLYIYNLAFQTYRIFELKSSPAALPTHSFRRLHSKCPHSRFESGLPATFRIRTRWKRPGDIQVIYGGYGGTGQPREGTVNSFERKCHSAIMWPLNGKLVTLSAMVGRGMKGFGGWQFGWFRARSMASARKKRLVWS